MNREEADALLEELGQLADSRAEKRLALHLCAAFLFSSVVPEDKVIATFMEYVPPTEDNKLLVSHFIKKIGHLEEDGPVRLLRKIANSPYYRLSP